MRTYPGDWAKPVEAIDLAQPGDVLVIDAGGVGPAIWGELATHSAIQRGLAGVVIDGAIRDSGDIVKLGFRRLLPPGDAQRRGTQGVRGDRRPHPHRQPQNRVRGLAPGGRRRGGGPAPEMAVEYANRAMDVLEKENRIREEIKEGRTLAQVTDLLRWEKKV